MVRGRVAAPGRCRGGRRTLVCALAATVLALVSMAGAQEHRLFFGEGTQEVVIDADTLIVDQENDTVEASGNVVIRRGEVELRADEVRFSRATSEAEAFGHVSLTDPDAMLFADHLHLNLDDEMGTLLRGQVYSQRMQFSLSGDEISKGIGQSYHIVNGRFTTCLCKQGPPSWSIAGKTLDVALNGEGRVEAGTFNILDIPVLYIPSAVIPVSRERQSGLLIPRFGVSNRRGFQLVQPYYWAINKSQDLTVAFDVETSARLGLIGEYRYALSRTFQGMWNASYFNEFLRGRATELATNPSVPENRYGILGEHKQELGPGQAYADVMAVSDDEFFRDINVYSLEYHQQVAFRTLPYTESRGGYLQTWDRVMVQGETQVYQNLVGPQRFVLQELPEVAVNGQKQLPFGLIGSVTSSGVDFQRPQGIDGLRFDIEPSLSLALPLGPSLLGSAYATYRQTAYTLTENEMTGGFTGTGPPTDVINLPTNSTREIPQLGASLGSGLSRVFDFPYFGFTKLKHVIEPTVGYLYIPRENQDDLPLFDGLDRVEHRSLITYGVANRLLARTAGNGGDDKGDIYELVRLSLAQSYDPTRLIPRLPGQGGENHLSDVDMDLRINPTRWVSLRSFSSFDTGRPEFSQVYVGIRLQEPPRKDEFAPTVRFSTRNTLNVFYRFVTQNQLQEVDADLLMRLTDQFGIQYAIRYDIQNAKFLENFFGLRVVSSCNCWSLRVGFSDTVNPNEVQVQAQFQLVGFGAWGSQRADLY